MNRFENYLQENCDNFRVETYGANYFDTVKMAVNGYCVSFENRYPAERFFKACGRFGYSVLNSGGCPGSYWFHLLKKDHVSELLQIMEYENQSVSECEKEMHESYILHGAGGDPGLNERLKNIMAYWENEYLKAAKQAG